MKVSDFTDRGGCEVSTPAERIRRGLSFAATLFPQSEAQDAIAALAELEQKHSATAIQFVKSLNRIAELERERDELRAGLERLARLYEDEHDLCERPMWLQQLIARPTRKGE